MKSIWPKTKKLLRFYSGCHGNQVTIAMRYEADAYHPKEEPYQMHVNLIRLKAKELQSEMYFPIILII